MPRYLGLVSCFHPSPVTCVLLMSSVMGGMLSDPVQSYPTLFGPNSSFGGQSGVQWLMKYPYALPMLTNFVCLSGCAVFVATNFEEVRHTVLVYGMVADLCSDTGSLQRKTRIRHLCYATILPRAQDCRSIVIPAILETALPRLRRRGSSFEPAHRPHGKLRNGRKGQTRAAGPYSAFSENMDKECLVHPFRAGLF